MDQWHGVGEKPSDLFTQDEEERRYTACRMQLLECRVR